MVVEISTPDAVGGVKSRVEQVEFLNTRYDCQQSGHIVGNWSPSSRTEKRRLCVVPGCKFIQAREIKPGL